MTTFSITGNGFTITITDNPSPHGPRETSKSANAPKLEEQLTCLERQGLPSGPKGGRRSEETVPTSNLSGCPVGPQTIQDDFPPDYVSLSQGGLNELSLNELSEGDENNTKASFSEYNASLYTFDEPSTEMPIQYYKKNKKGCCVVL